MQRLNNNNASTCFNGMATPWHEMQRLNTTMHVIHGKPKQYIATTCFNGSVCLHTEGDEATAGEQIAADLPISLSSISLSLSLSLSLSQQHLRKQLPEGNGSHSAMAS